MMTDPIVLIIIGIFLVIFFIFRRKKQAEVIWLDHGITTRALVSHSFKLAGKPDAILKDTLGRLTLVEYKGRQKNVYESDIVQAKAAAIVMRENGYDIQKISIRTKSDSHTEALLQTNKQIYREIEKHVVLTRRALNDKNVPAYPANYKCRFCSKRHRCKEAT